MSPITFTSTVEINDYERDIESPDIDSNGMSPSRFSSNSINTVILNPGATTSTFHGEPEQEDSHTMTQIDVKSSGKSSPIRT